MDEDRWENIILGEITVLSRLNHPHAAPPPFVAGFPITKLAADITHICTDFVSRSPAHPFPLEDGEGGEAQGDLSQLSCLSSSGGSEDPTEAKISTDFTKLPLQHGTTLSTSTLQQLPPEPKDHQPLSLHLGTLYLLSGFCGMSAKAMANRG